MASLMSRSLGKTSFIRPIVSKRFYSPASLSTGIKPLVLNVDRIVVPNRPFENRPLLNRRFFATENGQEDEPIVEEDLADDTSAEIDEDDWMNRRSADPKDRSRVIPLEVSLAYMDSAAYSAVYGDKKIWELYRRNFKNGITFAPTRKTCIRHGKISCGNPCPICRDEYLVIDYRNLKLLNQFLSDYNGELLSSQRTGVCRVQYDKLVMEIERAKDRGLLRVDPPFVEYDYNHYKPKHC